nr:MAG TPA: transmembrane protein [Caudoviricetes sp.]
MNNKQTSGGIDFTDLLTIVFIILKLCGVIAWSWWWVLSPLWISAIGWVILLIIALLIGGKNDEGKNDT